MSWLDHSAASDHESDGASSNAENSEESEGAASNPFQASTTAVLGETLMGSVENLAQSGSFSEGEEDSPTKATSSLDSGSESNSSSDGSSSEEDDPAPSPANSLGASSESSEAGGAEDAEVSWEAEAEALSNRFGRRGSSQQSDDAEVSIAIILRHEAF